MSIIVAFLNICEHNKFVKGNLLGKKFLASLSDNKAIISDEQLFCFLQSLI